MHIAEFQEAMFEKFGREDKKKEKYLLIAALAEEVGELAKATLKKTKKEIAEEIVDVIFVAICIANYYDINVETALKEKYLKKSKEEIAKKW
ncbi:MAG: nucleotide pyrophosphohydrolase [Candidatus Hydrothermarchaeota archaeon]|nr:MAG: nucleotide pyrophosphohydrolase [Candidatus Hydrothermarchaeota archaeon]